MMKKNEKMRLETVLQTLEEYVINLNFIKLCYDHTLSNCRINTKIRITSTMVEPMETRVKSEESEEKKFAPNSTKNSRKQWTKAC